MKILVVGGLGYLGSILTDILSSNPENQVYVHDVCLWNNNLRDEIKYKENISNPRIDWDFVFWCATIDSPKFYNEMTNSFVIHQKDLFKELCEKTKLVNCSSFRLSYTETDQYDPSLKFMGDLERIAKKCDHPSYRIPCLYGPSPRMRWDTVVNNIFLNFIVRNDLFLEDEILTQIPVCSVYDMAKHLSLATSVFDILKSYKTISYCHEIYTLLELGHIIGKTSKKDYRVILNSGNFTRNSILEFQKHTEFNISLEQAQADFKKNIDLGNLPDYMNDSYNNELLIENAINAWKFVKTVSD